MRTSYKLGYKRSRWNASATLRPVVNTDGELLRKVPMTPKVGMATVTTLQFRKPARVLQGKLTGPQDMERPRPAYYAESGEKAQCLCRQAGSLRCPVAGHHARGIQPPDAWPYDVPWDDTVSVRPPSADRVRDAASGAVLVKRRTGRER